MPGSPSYHLAYVFERFPTFTQTFCVREVTELRRLGLRPLVFSIRDTRDEALEDHFPRELIETVHFLPPKDELVSMVKAWKDKDELPQEAVLTLRHWGDAPDKSRVYEAIYVGRKMAEAGVAHGHSHFAGVGARCCYWIKQFYGFGYSFTGHANDLFEPTAFEVGLDQLMSSASLVVTVSDYTASWLRERYPKCARKVKRVYNGLDLAPFEEAAKRRESDRDNLIVSVGRLIEKKGFDDLIRACAIVGEEGSVRFRCVVVGEGPLEPELQALADELGVHDELELAGAQSQKEIVSLLSQARVFALPCVTEQGGGKDNLPTVIMEAMAASLPCVSTYLAGVPEMVVDGETGLLAEERQPEAIAESIRLLLADRGMAERMGEAGQRRARELFAKEKTARSLRDALISHGRLRFDRGLVKGDPGISGRYMAGLLRSLLGRLRRQKPSRFARADRQARRERAGSG